MCYRSQLGNSGLGYDLRNGESRVEPHAQSLHPVSSTHWDFRHQISKSKSRRKKKVGMKDLKLRYKIGWKWTPLYCPPFSACTESRPDRSTGTSRKGWFFWALHKCATLWPRHVLPYIKQYFLLLQLISGDLDVLILSSELTGSLDFYLLS